MKNLKKYKLINFGEYNDNSECWFDPNNVTSFSYDGKGSSIITLNDGNKYEIEGNFADIEDIHCHKLANKIKELLIRTKLMSPFEVIQFHFNETKERTNTALKYLIEKSIVKTERCKSNRPGILYYYSFFVDEPKS